MWNSIGDIKESLRQHNEWRSRCLNMVASENVTSRAVRQMLTCDLGHRYPTYYDDPLQPNYLGTKSLSE